MPIDEILKPEANQALQNLSQIETSERSLLEQRIIADEKSNAQSVNGIVFANLFDLLMILLALAFLSHEKKTAAELQKALRSALAHVETVNQNLQASIARKDSRFKAAVHDLKNPLGSIIGFAELLNDEAGNRNSVVEMSQLIQRISNSTLNLVGEVLSDEVENHGPPAPLPVLASLKEVCRFLEPVAKNKKQKIVVDEGSVDFILSAKAQAVQDIFYNLIGNALKFSPYSSQVTLKSSRKTDFYEIEIKDEGPGFARDDFPKLFKPGSKLSAQPSGGELSTGIGLLSVKQALDELQVQIDIANNREKGACVTLRFPTVLELVA